jgi:hypothetical protein
LKKRIAAAAARAKRPGQQPPTEKDLAPLHKAQIKQDQRAIARAAELGRVDRLEWFLNV